MDFEGVVGLPALAGMAVDFPVAAEVAGVEAEVSPVAEVVLEAEAVADPGSLPVYILQPA